MKPPPPIIIPAWLDDAGLSTTQFRVLCHVARRQSTGTNQRACDASIESIARVCRIKAATARQALRALVEYGLVTATQRAGRTTVYRVNQHNRRPWQDSPQQGAPSMRTPTPDGETPPSQSGNLTPSPAGKATVPHRGGPKEPLKESHGRREPKGCETPPPPPICGSSDDRPTAHRTTSTEEIHTPERTQDKTIEIGQRIKTLAQGWNRPAAMTADENRALRANLEAFQSIGEADWDLLKSYFAAQLPEGAGFWKPRNRSQLIKHLSDIIAHADRWATKCRRPCAPTRNPNLSPAIR